MISSITINKIIEVTDLNTEDLIRVINSEKIPVIRVKPEVEESEQYDIGAGMLARVKGVSVDDEFVSIVLDLNDFIQHNQSVAKPEYYNDCGDAVLTWFESSFYPSSGLYTVHAELEEDLPFEFIDQDSLLDQYVSSGSDCSYVEWLEQKVHDLTQ